MHAIFKLLALAIVILSIVGCANQTNIQNKYLDIILDENALFSDRREAAYQLKSYFAGNKNEYNISYRDSISKALFTNIDNIVVNIVEIINNCDPEGFVCQLVDRLNSHDLTTLTRDYIVDTIKLVLKDNQIAPGVTIEDIRFRIMVNSDCEYDEYRMLSKYIHEKYK